MIMWIEHHIYNQKMGGEVWVMLRINSDTWGSTGCLWAQIHWKMGVR